jgi:hypothetical protein
MKKCLVCDEEAQFAIKETKDFYCKECAEEQFGDVSYLVTIENNGNKEEPVDSEKVNEE